jgi:hypothetical protein
MCLTVETYPESHGVIRATRCEAKKRRSLNFALSLTIFR